MMITNMNSEKSNCRVMPHILTPEDLGIAFLGNPHTAIAPLKRRIDRAEYGRRLAGMEGGEFTPFGYSVPIKKQGGNTHAV